MNAFAVRGGVVEACPAQVSIAIEGFDSFSRTMSQFVLLWDSKGGLSCASESRNKGNN